MILRQHKTPVKHDLSVVLGNIIRSLLKPAPKAPRASLVSSGMPKALWHCFHFLWPLRLKWLLKPQLRKCDVEQGEETLTQIEICCLLGLKKKSVLDSSWIRTKCGSSARKKQITSGSPASWLRKEIVSHVQGFKRPYKNKQGYLFWWTFGFQGPEQPNSLQSRWQFQTSRIDMSQHWLLLFHWHSTLSMAKMHSCSSSEVTTALVSFSLWSLVLVQLSGTFTKRWNPAAELCKNLYLWKDDRYRSSTNKSWITRDLHSGQIFQLAIKSYLLLTGNDGRKWCVVTIEWRQQLFRCKAVSMMQRRWKILEDQLSGTSSHWWGVTVQISKSKQARNKKLYSWHLQ